MSHDILVTFETSPRLTEVQIRQLFEQMGDEHYHTPIQDAVTGGGVGGGTNPTITIGLDRRDGGRLEGMEIETATYLRQALEVRGIGIDKLEVHTIPDDWH